MLGFEGLPLRHIEDAPESVFEIDLWMMIHVLIHGLCMVYVWLKYGLYTLNIWLIYGLYIV